MKNDGNSKIKSNSLRLAALGMAAALTLACGCGGGSGGDSSGGSNVNAETKLPIVDEEITLKWWYPTAPQGIASWSDSIVFKELKERTNINIEFEIPSGNAGEQYTLMMASGTYPDIITHAWFGYGTNPDDAIEDDVYFDLTEYYDNGTLPNYKKIVEEADVEGYIRSLGGKITYFANVRKPGVERQPSYVGPIVRKDWLDKLGLDEPVTISDWYNMLKAFKTQLRVQKPLTMKTQGYDWTYTFMNAYGINDGFTVEDGKVVYGPADDRMLAYVTEMNKWYKEGLLILEEQDEKNYYNDTTGSWNHGFYLLETWKSQAVDPNYNAIGVDYPVLNEGDVIKVTYADDKASSYGQGTFITTSNKYPLETAKMFDYMYSEEGQILSLYGVEGVSYEKDSDGNPKFNDYMLNNSSGKSFLEMIKSDTFPNFVNDWHIELQGFSEKEVETLTEKWSKVKDNNTLPRLDYYGTADEIKDANRIGTEINTYARAKITAFINGTEALSNWDAYVEQLKNMGLDELTSITQSKYDAFLENSK